LFYKLMGFTHLNASVMELVQWCLDSEFRCTTYRYYLSKFSITLPFLGVRIANQIPKKLFEILLALQTTWCAVYN